MKKKLSENAMQKTKKNRKLDASERFELANEITRKRAMDRKLLWGVSYHADLAATNQALGIDLQKMVRELGSSGGHVLEIGCGSGKTVSQLKELFPKTAFSATGLAIEKKWMDHKNFRKIDWHVAHADQLGKIFKGRKFQTS